ncbi:AAA family ATPase [Schaalia sp. ZJ1691]|uniref:HelD family protein n=1 Tax=Schaalia sp. ZJ1691 TaxID=2709404 RepID=UPI001F150418|nr:AAA family ATPase [Schaalia sp. ZJ1691]
MPEGAPTHSGDSSPDLTDDGRSEHEGRGNTASLPEQDFVTRAYRRLDELRESYRTSQQRTHAVHGVGNAQAWTEREALSSHLGDMAARLEGVEERLVFGRLDCEDSTVRHIGRTSLSQTDGSVLLIDWRAPAAQPFYQATAVDPQGIVRRRHITTQGRRVTALEDELLTTDSPRVSDLDLHGEGALMSALESARDGHMGDIVSTIQAEQDSIIRARERQLIVVQGGPGTGKTAVALHRIAYLLYAERERLERSGVLLIGPSRIFLRYIEQVLPSLGETGVVSMTLGDLVPGIRPQVSDSESVAQIKGRTAWARVLKEAVRLIPRVPAEDVRLRVWNRDVVLRREDVKAARTKARRSGRAHNRAREGFALELMDVLATTLARASGDVDTSGVPLPDEKKAWLAEIRDSLDARRAINLAWMPTSAPDFLRRLLSSPALLAQANERAGSPLSERDCAAVERPRSAPWTFSDIPLLDELEELLGPLPGSAQSSRSGDSRGDIERAQRAIEGQGLGGGIVTAQMLADATRDEPRWVPLSERAAADRSWTYGHIVVDEAQDLSPMAWRALLRRCPSRSFTVVGDLDQRRGQHRPRSWAEALGPAARALEAEFALTVSYRTPRTLTRIAQAVMARLGEPVTYPMTAVRDVDGAYSTVHVPLACVSSSIDEDEAAPSSPEEDQAPACELGLCADSPVSREEDPLWRAAWDAVARATSRLDDVSGLHSGRVAVIVSDERARAWGGDLTGERTLSERVTVLSAAAAKGLEFDSVVIVEPHEVLTGGAGDLFVALTRATHDLTVVHSGNLPAGMDEWGDDS